MIEDNVKKLSQFQIRDKVKSGLNWFRSLIKKSKQGQLPIESAFNPATDVFIGGMFFYTYDPKWKEKLPIWDKYPLVIPISIYNDGWLGLNLHYLNPNLRVKLLDALMKLRVDFPNKDSYMRVSYSRLSTLTSSKLFEPCIKRYLKNHLKSPLVKVSSDQWETVALLPLQHFNKRTSPPWGKKGSVK